VHLNLSLRAAVGRGFAAQVAGKLDGIEQFATAGKFSRGRASPMDLSQYDGIQFWVRGDGQFQFSSLQSSITDADNYSTGTIEGTADWSHVRIWFQRSTTSWLGRGAVAHHECAHRIPDR